MARIVPLALLSLALICAWALVPKENEPIPAQFNETQFVPDAIAKAAVQQCSTSTVYGITVPHHILAADLIAQAFIFASSTQPELVVLLSPDHYNAGDSSISVTQRDFRTPYGTITTDKVVVNALERLSFVHEQLFFYREYGIGAELPFIKYFFPRAHIVVIALKESIRQDEADALIAVLSTHMPTKTLIVQSTDFSHYLTPDAAQMKDAQTLSILQRRDPQVLWELSQPANLDSIASQYVQMQLQKTHFGTRMKIIAHKNSQAYTTQKVTSSTSYIVQVYTK